MSENYAFPDRIRHFRFDREMTMGDHVSHDPSDWHWYVRTDLYDDQAAEITRIAELERQLTEAWNLLSRAEEALKSTGCSYPMRIAAEIRALKGAAK